MGSKFTSFAGVELGKATLDGIQKVLGRAKVVETGDAGEYLASICYAVPGGVVLFFTGELGRSQHELEGFGLARKTDRKPCSKWPASKSAPKLVLSGLELGMSAAEFRRVLGVKVQSEGKEMVARFEGKLKLSRQDIQRLPKEDQAMIESGKQQDYFDVLVSVKATFDADRLSGLRVWKSVTY